MVEQDSPDASTSNLKKGPTSTQSGSKQEACRPNLSLWQIIVLWACFLLGPVALLFSVFVLGGAISMTSTVWSYVALGVLPILIIVNRYLRVDIATHIDRLEDCSEIEATFIEAETVEPRLNTPELKPDSYDEKVDQLKKEVARLKRIGVDCWTEYQVLSLNQLLVEFLDIEDLKERARSSLADLEEYAYDSSYAGYELRHYDRWAERIDNAIRRIDEVQQKDSGDLALQKDTAAEPLRAILVNILEHVASYTKSWSEGSAFIRSLITCCAGTVPILLAMGLLPLIHPSGDGILRIYNWAFLGLAGSLTGVLLDLRKSDVVEVGLTEGKKELWRAVIGAVLGLVAGTVIYSMIAGKLLEGNLFPLSLDSDSLTDTSRSVFWAIASGFSFERVVHQLRFEPFGVSK